MRNIATLIAIITVFLTTFVNAQPTAPRESTVFNKEVNELTLANEKRLRESIQNFLGPEARVVVSVFFKEKGATQLSQSQATPALLPDGSSWLLFGGYLPEGVSDPETKNSLTEKRLEIEEAEVLVQVESFIKADAQSAISRIVKEALRPLPVKVSVRASLLPPALNPKALEEKPESSKDAKEPSIQEQVDTFNEFTKRFAPYLPLVGALFLALGVLLLAYMMREGIRDLADGVRSSRSSVANSGKQEITLTSLPSLESAAPKLPPKPKVLPSATPQNLDHRKDIKAVEHYILNEPLIFVRSIDEDPSDLLGLKYLVAKVSPEAKTLIKELVGIEKLLKVSSYQAGAEVVDFNAVAWVEQLLTKMEMKKLAGGTIVEENVSGAESIILANASEDQLFSAAINVNNPPTWRVVSDFVSSDYLFEKTKSFDERIWRNYVKASAVDDGEQIRAAAKALIEKVRAVASENIVTLKAQREREEHFVKKVLSPLIGATQNMDFGEDERFIEQMQREASEFSRIIKQSIWTPSRLTELNDDQLSQTFLKLDNERKAYLIAILPNPHSERLLSFVPQGNARKIIDDMVNRLNSTADDSKRRSMRALAREFLDYLRLQFGQVEAQSRSIDAEVVSIEPQALRKAS